MKLKRQNTPVASLTPYQSQYIAWQLSRRMGADLADFQGDSARTPYFLIEWELA